MRKCVDGQMDLRTLDIVNLFENQDDGRKIMNHQRVKIALMDTYRPVGCRGGVGNFTILLGQALNKIISSLDIYTSEPEVFSGCNTILDHTFKTFKLSRRLRTIQKMLKPETLSQDYSHILLPHPFEPLVEAPNAKKIMVIHDLIPLFFRRYTLKNIGLYVFYRCYLPHILNRVDKVVAVSENTKEDLLRVYNLPSHKVHVIPSGYNSKLSTAYCSETTYYGSSNNYILCISNGSPHKNVARLIQAMSLIGNKLDIDLYVVGISRFDKKYIKMSKQHNIHNRVYFLENIPDDELASIMKKARALVFPSLYEGFGMPPLEAMSCGVPTVVSNRSSIPEVCGDAAVYFDPLSVMDMATAIEKVLTDNVLREQCIMKGYGRVKKYSWDIIAREYLELIYSLN